MGTPIQSPWLSAVALAVAAALGAVVPVAGQGTLRGPDRLPPAASPSTRQPGNPSGIGASANRQEDTQVELAWLADPITFPWALEARIGGHPEGRSVDLFGYVPTEAIRQHAVQLARDHCSLPVMDRLQILPNLPMPFGNLAASMEVRQVVLDQLRVVLGDRLQRLQVQPAGDGRVVVSGAFLSPDEQLQVARSLRALNGCRSVVCQLGPTPGEDVKGTGYETAGSMVVESPARAAANAGLARARGVDAKAAPYETTGVIEWEGPPALPVVPRGPAGGPLGSIPARPFK